MIALTEQVVDDVVRRLVESLSPLEIYLFGSAAKGTTTKDSDLDFLVVVEDQHQSPREASRQGRLSLAGVGVPVDLVVCTSADFQKWSHVSCNLIHTAVTTGRRIYAAAG